MGWHGTGGDCLKILIIDGQGGGLGRQLVTAVKEQYPEIEVLAVGTNSAATNAMLRAGADRAATGENSVVVASGQADVIMGPLGMVIADSMLGEITPRMALAVGRSRAKRILVPVSQCDNIVAGTQDISMAQWPFFRLLYDRKIPAGSRTDRQKPRNIREVVLQETADSV